MMDFLKAYPFITMEQYLWEIPVPKLELMAADATRIIYLNEKQAQKYKGYDKRMKNNKLCDNTADFYAELGI